MKPSNESQRSQRSFSQVESSITNVSQLFTTGQRGQMSIIEVSKQLQDGEKFIKWDEDSCSGTPVTMRVDSRGFFLYWIDQNCELDVLDISTIRDVRTNQYAKKPKDSKLRQIVTMGSQDTLEEKTITVCFGADFVNVSFINFCCTRKDIAQHWSEELLRITYNINQLNGSTLMFLQKAHTKLCLQVDKTGKIPIKNIMKLFAISKEDRKRVEKALDVSGLPSGKADSLPIAKFQFEDFYNLYKNLVQRIEVEKIFDDLVGTSKRRCISVTQLVEFLNHTQRDPRLNEILHPYANPARAKEIISEYEPNKFNAQKGQLSLDGFLRYLISDDNPIMAPNKLDICDDMEQPLSHYFINSSHNTYLTGHQLTGKSSVEIYRQCLLAGCRCVELDFWNGRTDEPVVVHGYTFVPEIFAKDVLEAIAESAFKTSEFPVILSFENHCNPRQQAKIANYCREIFGEMLLDNTLDSHPLEPGVVLPPPHLLKRKIIIKNKKKHHHHHHHHHKKTQAATAQSNNSTLRSIDEQPKSNQIVSASTGSCDEIFHAPPLQQLRQSSKESTGSSDSDESSSEDDVSMPIERPVAEEIDKVQQAKETEAGAEISALVNYVQPVHFSSFENSEKKNRFYEMSSFDEKQATTLLKERPIEFVNYNKHQLSRVYPAGTRFDSSNFMPQLFWNAGCQLVALNYQTLDLAMQLNLGIFEYNHRSGFILKPEFMRRNDRRLDPFAESMVDGIIAGTVSIQVLSGQFLTDKKVGTYVEVDMFGLPADTVRKKFRTKIIRENGINPIFEEEPFVFKKVVLPELASIRIATYEESGKFIGHRVLPVVGLCPGYRHVTLRTEVGLPIGLATVFLCIVVKDYVPDQYSDFAEALANPIKYQSELEKRAKQLAVLTEDMEHMEYEGNNSCTNKKDIKIESINCLTGSPKKRDNIPTVSSGSTEKENDTNSGANIQTQPQLPSGLDNINSNQTVSGQSQVQVITRSIVNDTDKICVEPLDRILENKSIREKRFEMEKKLEMLRKKHDKDKVRVTTQKSADFTDGIKKSKFYTNKLVKRLSSKNMDTTTQIPPCLTEISEECNTGEMQSITQSQSERLLLVCKEFSNGFKELQEKYHEIIYNTAEKVLKNSQLTQMKVLHSLHEKETTDVMRHLQIVRRNEVKTLALKHRDRDELVRRKREVATVLVERGVAERVRLTQLYEQKKNDLQKQHDIVRQQLQDHKQKAKNIIGEETGPGICTLSDGFLVLFQNAVYSANTSSQFAGTSCNESI